MLDIPGKDLVEIILSENTSEGSKLVASWNEALDYCQLLRNIGECACSLDPVYGNRYANIYMFEDI